MTSGQTGFFWGFVAAGTVANWAAIIQPGVQWNGLVVAGALTFVTIYMFGVRKGAG